MIFFHLVRGITLPLIASMVIVMLTLVQAKAQNISFSYVSETANFAPDQFLVNREFSDGNQPSIRLRGDEIIFGGGTAMLAGYHQLSISEDRSFIGALFLRGEYASVEIYRADGSLIHRIGRLAEYESGDPSVKLYMLNDGSFIYRDNIAGFSYFDERGELVFRAYNSYGSPDGELISEIATAPYGHAFTLYNPKFFEGGRTGSRIQMVSFDGETQLVSRFGDETLNSIQMHSSGRLMLAHILDESTGGHKGRVISYRGDIIADIDYEDLDILELVLSADAKHVTARTSGRVMVHQVDSGERLGSASFGEQVLTAQYMPDGILAVLTGRTSGNGLNSLRAHMIDLERRRVVRETTSLTTHFHNQFPLSLQYVDKGTYQLKGVSREIRMRHTL